MKLKHKQEWLSSPFSNKPIIADNAEMCVQHYWFDPHYQRLFDLESLSEFYKLSFKHEHK